MFEVTGNLWDYSADAVVITTNGTIKTSGDAVMGRGCAKEAAQKYKWLPTQLGSRLLWNGNHVFSWGEVEPILITFPVKREWQEKANLKLIENSCIELVAVANNIDRLRPQQRTTIVMPRPGCGNGGLDWNEVRQICSMYLDRRFHVITFA